MNPNNHLPRVTLVGALLFFLLNANPAAAQSVANPAASLVESVPVWSMPEANREVKPDPKAKVIVKDLDEEHEAKLQKAQPGSFTQPRQVQGNAIERNPTNREAIRHVVRDAKHSADEALSSNRAVSVQRAAAALATNALNAPSVSFEGISHLETVEAGQGFIPPDTNGAAGPKHYVQTVNSCFRVWDKTGTPLTAPIPLSALFEPLGGPCAKSNDGDPIVLYDQLADRWLISQFCLIGNPNYHQLIAISKTGDPTGAYYLYDFAMPNDKFNDYPHLGVWTDAYYMTDNQFGHDGHGFKQAGVFAFDRAKMLAGDPNASYIYFDTAVLFPRGIEGSPNGFQGLGGMLPASADGLIPPPAGAPGLFACFQSDEYGDPGDQLRIFNFHADFKDPAQSRFKERIGSPLKVAPFDPVAESQAGPRNVIPQPPPAQLYTYLDAIQDRLMFRLAYRNFGHTEALVLNHTVNSAVYPAYRAGVRLYELTRTSPAAAFKIAEQQTFDGAAEDTLHRWMGSVAMNFRGDIALGYSASSETEFPSIRYTAKLGTDPAGSGLAQGEQLMIAGGTSQVHGSGRWGDYSAMTPDPSDDCSFWYTQEYYPASDEEPNTTWHTRIVNVTAGPAATSPRGTITGKITNCQTGLPVANALVEINGGYSRATGADGTYEATVAPGTYTATVNGVGYDSATSASLVVTNGGNATFDACLHGNVKNPVADSISVTSDSCNANSAIDPNETVTVSFGIKNTGTTNLENVVATLQSGHGVAVPSGPQNYGTIVAGGETVFRAFTFRVVNMACGAPVDATLKVMDGAADLGTISYHIVTGATSSYEYGTGNIATPIPDYNYDTPDGSARPGTVEIPIDVTDAITVEDVNVSLRLNHTFDHDINIYLVHPDGTAVTLNAPFESDRARGRNYGSGPGDCSGVVTVFDDSATDSIIDAFPPFDGTFKPEKPLSALDGKPAAGQWKLRIVDNESPDKGTVWCVKLELNRKQVCCGPLIAAAPPAAVTAESYTPANSAPDPGETITMSLPLMNFGEEATDNLVATLRQNEHVRFVTGAENSQVYGAVPNDETPVSRPFTFKARGDCGGKIKVVLQLADGSKNLGAVAFDLQLGKTEAGTLRTFANTAAIAVPGGGTGSASGAPANSYPSTIKVAGVNGRIGKMTVTLKRLNHSFPGDVDVLLINPSGRGFILMSDTVGQANWHGQTYTFDDDAPTLLPRKTLKAPASGSYKPTNYSGKFGELDSFAAPVPGFVGYSAAPVGPDTLNSTFLTRDAGGVNGTWQLFVVDDSTGDIGSFSDGWELSFTPTVSVCTSP